MQLYEKQVSKNGRVSYVPQRGAGIVEMDNNVLATMITTFVVGMIEATQSQLETHSRHGRELRKLEEAVIAYAKKTAVELDPLYIDVVVNAWNSAMLEMQRRLQ